MLNGLQPIIIFQFSKLAPSLSETIAKIPLVSQFPSLIAMPPIPVYLAEEITGLFIDTESKNVDIETDVQTLTNGQPPDVNQKGVSSTVTIDINARKDSLGIALLSAMMDIIFDKVTSKEYSVSYLHGPITVFQGVVHSFAVNQTANSDLLTVKIELSKGSKAPTKPNAVPTVPGQIGLIPVGAVS